MPEIPVEETRDSFARDEQVTIICPKVGEYSQPDDLNLECIRAGFGSIADYNAGGNFIATPPLSDASLGKVIYCSPIDRFFTISR